MPVGWSFKISSLNSLTNCLFIEPKLTLVNSSSNRFNFLMSGLPSFVLLFFNSSTKVFLSIGGFFSNLSLTIFLAFLTASPSTLDKL